jgi:hypothetical protein
MVFSVEFINALLIVGKSRGAGLATIGLTGAGHEKIVLTGGGFNREYSCDSKDAREAAEQLAAKNRLNARFGIDYDSVTSSQFREVYTTEIRFELLNEKLIEREFPTLSLNERIASYLSYRRVEDKIEKNRK